MIAGPGVFQRKVTMEISHAIILAIVQGLTEFLPISSTAHLIMVPILSKWPDQGLSFDIALNTGTWLAVLIYFRGDLLNLFNGFLRTIKERGIKANPNHDVALAWMVLVGTIPIGLIGFLAHDIVAHQLRTLQVIAWSSIVWGVVLWIADKNPGRTEVAGLKWPTAIFVGLAQALALVPGTSRSGITMTAGLFSGLSRTAAARYSFLLATVVGALAAGLEGFKMLKHGLDTPLTPLVVGFIVTFITAYLAIHYFLKIISRHSMKGFVAYRVALGLILLVYAYWV